ncbi:hypothetical protein FOA52_005031 [Chlamydomonas sp. UWO 241]|nr:hypothetical protein FOA52_005031 [Chlamydomonas sp. UWO 241]
MESTVILPGVANTVAFWYELDVDEYAVVSNAPARVQQQQGQRQQQGQKRQQQGQQQGQGQQQEQHQQEQQQGQQRQQQQQQEQGQGQQQAPLPPQHQHQHQQFYRGSRGQALQYLNSALPVAPGDSLPLTVTVSASSGGGGGISGGGGGGAGLRFGLADGVQGGVKVPRPPWLQEWGGGVAVESPHVQRVKYCDLLVADLLQRLPCGRFPSVSEDVKVMAAHCGALYLDPGVLGEVATRLCLLEDLYSQPQKLPSVLPEHVDGGGGWKAWG